MQKLSVLTFLALGCISLPGHAQIVQTVSGAPSATNDWNTAEWGNPAAVPTSGNTYISTTGLDSTAPVSAAGVPSYSDTVRVVDNPGTNSFLGSSLTLVGNSRLLLKQTGGDSASANLILQNNSDIQYAPNGYSIGTLAGTMSIAAGNTAYIGGGNLVNGVVFNINSVLTGSGTLDVYNVQNDPTIVFGGNLSGFSGDLDYTSGAVFSITTTNLSKATLTFSTATETAAGSSFAINNAINVAALMLGSTSLSAGSYTAAQLNSGIGGGSTFFTGASDITVIPEPSVSASMLAGLALLLGFQAMRRRTA